MIFDKRAILAANNNADLYEAMFTSHGVNYDRHSYALIGREAPPPYYANITILSPNHVEDVTEQARKLSKQLDSRIVVKDSFCQIDLEKNGFEVLFGASWIWRESSVQVLSDDWYLVENEADLLDWEAVWKATGSPTQHHMFNAKMLEKSDIFFLGRKKDGTFDAGCIANHSGDCIGISNAFSTLSNAELFADAASAVASIDPSVPIVGYESGEDLGYALRANFQTVGELRILKATAASF